MLSHYHFTDAELKKLLQSMVVLVDTREQENAHVKDYLATKGVTVKAKKLDYGDYSFMLPAASELGIVRDVYFNGAIAIERKASLEELSHNLAQERCRFENELIRAQGCRLFLLIERGGYGDIVRHNYETQYEPKSFVASLLSLSLRYNVSIAFVDKVYAGNFIYYVLYYWLRNWLLGCK